MTRPLLLSGKAALAGRAALSGRSLAARPVEIDAGGSPVDAGAVQRLDDCPRHLLVNFYDRVALLDVNSPYRFAPDASFARDRTEEVTLGQTVSLADAHEEL